MGAEILTVTTSARRLWELVHRPIGHALAELDGGPHEFRLGGGTVLAARWHHRDSFDIDLVVERSVPLSELAVVDGTPTLVLDTAQILHGKLERADKVVVRDAFDLIVAAELDPHALA